MTKLRVLFVVVAFLPLIGQGAEDIRKRPNILFAIADDWGYHAGVYGTRGIETPVFDQLATNGIRFERAFANVPSCTPARGVALTGQPIWKLGPGANLHSRLAAGLPVYPDLLETAGYHVGFSGKGWGPGSIQASGRERNPAGSEYDGFEAFFDAKPEDKPFCFWFGGIDPHRPYEDRLWETWGVDPSEVEVPPYLPDTEEVRRDIANYYAEIKRFNADTATIISYLKDRGELQNTLIVMTGDHGWPFPRGKSNLYDAGTRVPLAIWWPDVMNEFSVVKDFVSFEDLAPTFMEVAGLDPLPEMTGRSLLPYIEGKERGNFAGNRDHVILAKERHHGLCRVDGKGYPSRAIRTEHFLYIRNYDPNRWPAGSPFLSSSQGIFSDTDAGPAKNWMIEHASDSSVLPLFELAFGKRPAEELYDMRTDPYQMHNLADNSDYRVLKGHLSQRLNRKLEVLGDPRETGEKVSFDEYPYYVDYGVKQVDPPQSVTEALQLQKR